MANYETLWIHEMPWPAIEAYLEHDDIALLPIGATEQHGPHLPLMVDTGWAMAMAEGAAERTGVLIAPPQHVGMSYHHLAYPGSLTLRPETLTQVVIDMAESLIWHGFKKLIVVNGNRIANLPPLEIAALRLRHTTGAYVAVVDAGLMAKTEALDLFGADGLDHAGDAETSMMLHHRPELVDMDAAPAINEPMPEGEFPRSHAVWAPPFDVNTVSVWEEVEEFRAATAAGRGAGADARAATADKGAAICQALAQNLARFIEADVRPAVVEIKRRELPI